MRVFVDGAAGFVGGHVVDALRATGQDVVATDHPRVAHGAIVGRDLLRDPIGDLVRGCDAIVHVAGLFDLAACTRDLFAANVTAAERVARAAVIAGVPRFVHVSSVTVYGRPERAPIDEDAPLRPRGAYERSKAAGERAVRAILESAGIDLVILRPSGIYGPRGRYGLAALIASLALVAARGGRGHRSIRGPARMTHVHVEDVAAAVVHALAYPERMRGRAFNVADESPIAGGDLIETIERELGLPTNARPTVITPRRARAMVALAPLLARRTRTINASLERKWSALCEASRLERALVPRIDPAAYAYWSGDHVYAIEALRATGFVLRHPNVRVGLRSTLAWYRAERWIPSSEVV